MISKALKAKMLSHVCDNIEERKDMVFHGVMQYSFKDGWEASKWISVEDRLPLPCVELERGQHVSWEVGDTEHLLVQTSEGQTTAWYSHETKEWIVSYHLATSAPMTGDYAVTHWQPLPKPPTK